MATAGKDAAPPWFGLRMSLGFCAQFLFVGLYLPYFPLWLESKSLTPTQISTVLSMALVVRVLTTGQVTVFADRQDDRAKVLTALYFGSAITILLYLVTDMFWTILAVTILFNFFFNPILPLLDAITLAGVRRFAADYGKIRLWGSLVFIFANLGGGFLLAGFEPEAILLAIVLSILLGAAVSLLTPRIGRVRPAGEKADEKLTRKALLSNRLFVLVLLGAGLAQASHAMLYGFGSIHWQTLGHDGAIIGLFWAIGVIAEMVLFQYSAAVFKRMTAIGLIALGCLCGLVRWAVFPFVEAEAAIFLLQILHGLSFGAVHIGTMHFIMDAVPEEHIGAAQGAGYVLGGIVMGLAVWASGPIYASIGVYGFWVMAAICAVAAAIMKFAANQMTSQSTPKQS